MRKFPPLLVQLTDSKDRSIYNQQQHHPPILPWAATHIQSLSLCLSFSPFFYSHANKGNRGAPTVHSFRHRPTSARQTLSLPLQLSSFPSGGCIDPEPKRIPAAEMLSRAKAFLKPNFKRVLRNYPNNKAMIMRACRAASHDFQRTGRKAEELDARRLRIVGVLSFLC